MYIISCANCSRQLSVGRQYIKDTIEEAYDLAVKLALANGASESEEAIREEVEADASYLDTSGEWGVFIGQPEDEDPDNGKCPACGSPLQDDVCQNPDCDS